MLINNSGTVNFWFDPQKNPSAFIEGNNVMWGVFSINDEHCVITSEGKTLSVTMNPQTKRELLVFQTSITPNASQRHMVTVTWGPEKVCLYLDAVLQQEIHSSDLVWS